MLKIISAPNKILAGSVQPVVEINDKIRRLVADMEETLIAQNDPPGVGLSANQVGVNLSLFIIKPSQKSKIKVFINPKIVKKIETVAPENKDVMNHAPTKKHGRQPVKLEGCLSIPHIWGPVKRANKILVEYQDLSNQSHTESVKRGWFYDLEAIIIQHEIDHLNGILFTQRSLEQNQPLYEEKNGKLEKIENWKLFRRLG